ncbi:MAG: TadE/TadG family type IV pilus assembly protein [Candidatus Dormibacteria bacterium]
MRRSVSSRRGQSMVEFAMTIGLLMLLIVLTAQVAIYLHRRNSLALAVKEGAFEAALAGHTMHDGDTATQRMWATVEPGGGPITVEVSRSGRLITVTANAGAAVILPIDALTHISAKAVHTVETFEPGSSS